MTEPRRIRYTLPWADDRPALGRHVHHDPRSLRYAHPVLPRSALASQHWTRRSPVLDQGSIGSCTGNAAAGWLATDSSTRRGRDDVTEDLALSLYHEATVLDSYDGTYPPTDSGSDGLSVAKALQQAGYCTGYTHAFSVDALCTALQTGPALIGVSWYDSMFTPASDGRIPVRTSSGLAGGHELVVDQVVMQAGVPIQIWVTNSWSQDWGVAGRGYFTGLDLATLLADDGDVTVPTAPATPAPTPAPVDADRAFAAALRQYGWVTARHVGGNAYVARQGRAWLQAKGL